MKKYNVAVVGVGAVGVEMLRCLQQRKFPVDKLSVFARSSRDIVVDNKTYHVEAISPDGFEGVNIALFAGTEGEKGAAVQYAPEAVKRGALVIDNGADFICLGMFDFQIKQDVEFIKKAVVQSKHRKRQWIA